MSPESGTISSAFIRTAHNISLNVCMRVSLLISYVECEEVYIIVAVSFRELSHCL